MIIAIDGPAASGKGTMAGALADHLGLTWVDTGATYRLVALEHITNGTDPLSAAQQIAATTTHADFGNPELKRRDVGAMASKMAVVDGVRPLMVQLMRTIAENCASGAIVDGRDIGTSVFPEANFKLYVTASPEIRAKRRSKELQSKGFDVTYEAVLDDLRERDERDTNRKVAPLRPADDAIIVDTSDMSPEEMVEKALHLFAEHRRV